MQAYRRDEEINIGSLTELLIPPPEEKYGASRSQRLLVPTM